METLNLDNFISIIYSFFFSLFIYSKLLTSKNYHSKLFQCPICFEKNTTISILIPCGHYVCYNCSQKNLNICPFCRKNIDEIKIYEGYNCELHKYEYIFFNKNKNIYFCKKCNNYDQSYKIYGL